MRPVLRIAASGPPSSALRSLMGPGRRLASSQPSTGDAGREQPGDPGPSTLRNAKAQRRRLHAELNTFSQSAQKGSVDLETFNDILAASPSSSSRRPTPHATESIARVEMSARSPRSRPTLADSLFALPRKGEEVVLDDHDEIHASNSPASRNAAQSPSPRRKNPVRRDPREAPRRRTGGREGEQEPFKRIKDGPYALSGRLRRFLESNPSPLSTSQTEELIAMVTEAPKGDVNTAVWGQLLAVLGKEKKLDRMWRAYNDMKKSGIKASLRTYTTLLNAYASVAHSDSPVSGDAPSSPPEERTLSRVAIIYRQSQDHIARHRPVGDPTADSGLAYPRRRPSMDEDADEEVGVYATNAYLKFLARYGMYPEAEQVFKEMLEEEGDLGPDVMSFNSMFTALLKANAREEQARKQVGRTATAQRLRVHRPWTEAARSAPAWDPSDGPGERKVRRYAVEKDSPLASDKSPEVVRRPSMSDTRGGAHRGRQEDGLGTHQHRPKVGFGLPRSSGSHEARAYSTDGAGLQLNNGETRVTFDTLLQHVKNSADSSTSAGDTTTVQDMSPSKQADGASRGSSRPNDGYFPRQGRDRKVRSEKFFLNRRLDSFAPGPASGNAEGGQTVRKPRHRPSAALGPFGAAVESLSPPPAQGVAVPPPRQRLQIGDKARWLFDVALSRLQPAGGRTLHNDKAQMDQRLVLLAIECLLQGRPKDHRFALALIPRIFDLPPLPSTSSAKDIADEDLPENLPSFNIGMDIAASLVSCLTRANRPTAATHYATYFLSRERWDVNPDVGFYCNMVGALANTGDVHPILDILSVPANAKGGMRWPVYVYCEALTAARWAGDWEAAKKAWRMLEADYELESSRTHHAKKGFRINAKAMSLLLKVALAKGKKDVAEAMEIYERYGDEYGFGGSIPARRNDDLVSISRKVRRGRHSSANDATDGAENLAAEGKEGGSAWQQELRVDIERALELLSPPTGSSPSSS